jgi:hypothetical protein
VRLVDDQQRDRRGAQGGQHLVVGQLLRRQQQELLPPGGELGQRPLAVGRPDGRVEQRGPLAGGLQRAQLVVLQRDRRRDHQRAAVDELGRDRVDQRLAGAGGEHGERVPLQHRLDRLGLARPELVGADGLPGRTPNRCAGHGRSLPGRARADTRYGDQVTHAGARRTPG